MSYEFVKSKNALGVIAISFESPTCLERETELGCSHLIEHVKCAALKDKEAEYLAAGLVYNAYTGAHETIFFLEGLNEYLDKFAPEFVDRILNTPLSEEAFKRERNIVIRELEDSFADENTALFYNHMSAKHGIVTPIGTRPVLEDITFDGLQQLHDRAFLRPRVIHIGDAPLEISVEQSAAFHPEKASAHYVNMTQADRKESVSLLLCSAPVTLAKPHIADIITGMLGYGLTSPLYEEIREKRELAYGVGAVFWDPRRMGEHILSVTTSTHPDRAEEAFDVMTDVMTNPKYMTKKAFEDTVSRIRIDMLKSDAIGHPHTRMRRLLPSGTDAKNLNACLETITFDEMMEFYESELPKVFDRVKSTDFSAGTKTEDVPSIHMDPADVG